MSLIKLLTEAVTTVDLTYDEEAVEYFRKLGYDITSLSGEDYLASGAWSTAYLFNDKYVIKLSDDISDNEFAYEFETMVGVDHPNIAKVHYSGFVENSEGDRLETPNGSPIYVIIQDYVPDPINITAEEYREFLPATREFWFINLPTYLDEHNGKATIDDLIEEYDIIARSDAWKKQSNRKFMEDTLKGYIELYSHGLDDGLDIHLNNVRKAKDGTYKIIDW